jgi:hypothetical protein
VTPEEANGTPPLRSASAPDELTTSPARDRQPTPRDVKGVSGQCFLATPVKSTCIVVSS